ncbi:hypothetical protein NPX99_05410 [Bartonella sp. 220]|uniref:hypothetical protein n=1 Tax=Bartonella sp. 220B TaxID=2967260 RepID=UPI0022A978C2|nr:hypothetical protein [Bartonella sp. 220B]MCZ2158710.1 hypothetical protein [Bartonella sp. 220B]
MAVTWGMVFTVVGVLLHCGRDLCLCLYDSQAYGQGAIIGSVGESVGVLLHFEACL